MSMLEAKNYVSSLINTVETDISNYKAAGNSLVDLTAGGNPFAFNNSGLAERERYSLFRGWLYSAINAIASEAASQDVQIYKKNVSAEARKDLAHRTKSKPKGRKFAEEESELIPNHPFLDILESPNQVQGQWQFVYSFIASLNLTGWGYVVGGDNEKGEFELFSLPTTWVKPNHEEGPFSRFKIVDPTKPHSEKDSPWIGRENVGFAYMPNPLDPRLAYAPTSSQITAARIDDHIQSSQQSFFENGIFPSVVVTIGKDPHPEVSGGVRPRLTVAQRRQVTGAIKKTMAGVANYGNPAIVDGLIESINKLSFSSNEMGWEKSEVSNRARILSAFCVHPYILGENVNVGGYAQAAKIEDRFCKRVNCYLGMLSKVTSGFIRTHTKDNTLCVAWEKCAGYDPDLMWRNLNAARLRGDVSRNEIRVKLGLRPDESGGDRTHNFVFQDMQVVDKIQTMLRDGVIEVEQASLLYQVIFDLPADEATTLAGKPGKPAAKPTV